MSLNWSIQNVADWQELVGSEAVVTEAIVLSTLLIDLGGITEKNVDEFFTRLRIKERIFGPVLIVDGERTMITLEQVQRRIGLHVNVVDKTPTQFGKNVVRWLREEAEGDLRSAKGSW